jgi:DNA-directed RNA polymerase specialized sigma24 family protein
VLLLKGPDLALSHEPITELLDAARRGDAAAGERVFSALYAELREIARRERRRLHAGETLNTTAVVHEAYLRLLHDQELPWESRSHLLGTAAVAMRRLLIDRAREHQAQKRGGGARPVEFDEAMAAAPGIRACLVVRRTGNESGPTLHFLDTTPPLTQDDTTRPLSESFNCLETRRHAQINPVAVI